MNLSDDDFTLLGLPMRFAQDPEKIDAQWRALQQRIHPDRLVGQGAQAQALALQWSARLNEARQRLKNPLQRAMYLCHLRGHDLGSNSQTPAFAPLPPDFLMQQMQWHETLEEGQAAQDRASIAALLSHIQAAQQDLWVQCAAYLDDTPDTALAAPCLAKLSFLHRFEQRIQTSLQTLLGDSVT